MVTKRDLVVATTRHHRAGIKNNQGRGRSYRVLVTFYYSSTVMQNYAAILLAELLYCTLLAKLNFHLTDERMYKQLQILA